MQADLLPHPATPPGCVAFVSVAIDRTPDGLQLTFVVEGEPDYLVVPAPAKPYRTDELWRTTCFELFIRDADGTGYREFNLAPSGQWAAYRFESHRDGREPLGLDEPPAIWCSREFEGVMLGARIRVDVAPGARIGLCAVIEETDGTKSYWALAHPPGAPDFHHPDCFAIELPAAPAS